MKSRIYYSYYKLPCANNYTTAMISPLPPNPDDKVNLNLH